MAGEKWGPEDGEIVHDVWLDNARVLEEKLSELQSHIDQAQAAIDALDQTLEAKLDVLDARAEAASSEELADIQRLNEQLSELSIFAEDLERAKSEHARRIDELRLASEQGESILRHDTPPTKH